MLVLLPLLLGFGTLAKPVEAPSADAPLSEAAAPLEAPPPSLEAVARAQKSRNWRIGRVFALPVVGMAAGFGALSGLFFAFDAICQGSVGLSGDYLSGCGLGMYGLIFSAYVMLVPAAISGIGLLMNGRGQYGIAVLGALTGVLLSMVTALIGFPFFLWPTLTSTVLAPVGAVVAYEISSFFQESRVLERVQPIVMPLREGLGVGVRVALW